MIEGLNFFLNGVLTFTNSYREKIEHRTNYLLDEWDKSRLLPRKLKKKRRKEILIDWNLNEYAKKFCLPIDF